MIRIAVVDDEEYFLRKIRSLIKKMFSDNGFNCDIVCFSSALEFKSKCTENSFNVIFLDIDMPEISGMNLAKFLRESGSKAFIAFVSSYENFVFQAFVHSAYRFIRKLNLIDDLSEMVNSLSIDLKTSQRYIMLKFQDNRVGMVDLTKVMLFYSVHHDLFLSYKKDSFEQLAYRVYTMDKLEEMLSEKGFVRTHRGYIVNISYIYQIEQDKVILTNNVSVNMSKSRSEIIKKKFQEHLRKEGVI